MIASQEIDQILRVSALISFSFPPILVLQKPNNESAVVYIQKRKEITNILHVDCHLLILRIHLQCCQTISKRTKFVSFQPRG